MFAVYQRGMPKEIERRFLVDQSKLPRDKMLLPRRIRQGYLSIEPVVRVRLQGETHAWLTVKGPGTLERPEFEYPIPVAHAQEMWVLTRFRVEKIRHTICCYEISNVNKHWSIDEFLGPLSGLWLAEIELEHPDEFVAEEPWRGREVTQDFRYTNVWMAQYGLPEDSRSVQRTDDEIMEMRDLTKMTSEERSRYDAIMHQRAVAARLCDGPIGNTD